MLCFINQSFFLYSIVSPENKYNSLSFLWKDTNSSICKVFPSFSRMTRRKSRTNRKNSIEKKYSLFRPIRKICFCPFYPNICLKFFKNIWETWLWFWTIWYRKRKSHSSTWCMIWILSKDNHFYSIKWSHIESTKDIFPFRKTWCMCIFIFHKTRKLSPIRFFKFRGKYSLPRWMNTNGHNNKKIYSKGILFFRKINFQKIMMGDQSFQIYPLSISWAFLSFLEVPHHRDHAKRKVHDE